MKITIGKPPIWDNACVAFQINPSSVLFTYGDTIYNPGDAQITDDLMIHEQVHAKQQKHNDEDAALWWGKYLRDPEFRISQEVEAYAEQYKFLCRKIQNKQQRFELVKRMAEIMSGPLYGNCISFGSALFKIKEKANEKDDTSSVC